MEKSVQNAKQVTIFLHLRETTAELPHHHFGPYKKL